MNTFDWTPLKDIIDQSSKIVLTTHVRPDGDGLGAQAALFSFFDSIGKQVRIINYSPLPETFQYLNQGHIYEVFNTEIHHHFIEQADCTIILDCNAISRLEDMGPFVKNTQGKIVVIDHHLEPEEFADLLCISTDTCATGELVYDFISFYSGKNTVTKLEAEGIYTSIMTDTGNFRFPRTTAAVHRKVAYLIESGADPFTMYSNVFDQKTLPGLQLQGIFLNSIKTFYDGKLAVGIIKKNDFQKVNANSDDTEGFVQLLMSIQGVLMGLFLTETPKGFKISFRSKGDINVRDFASLYHGGGHKNASGGKLLSFDEKEIIKLIADAENYLSIEETV